MKKTTTQTGQCYSLPIEPGTSRLSLETLNAHSNFRLPLQGFLEVKVRTINFKAEVLTLGVTINREKEEQLYLVIKPDEILVSCNTNTSADFLSRHAYFGLFELSYLDGFYDFRKYYWPDFFDLQTGQSRYLNITKNAEGIHVNLKPGNNRFYKPGQRLFYPLKEEKREKRTRPKPAQTGLVDPVTANNSCVIGYCLADTNLNALHTNHLPYLVPYTGVNLVEGNELKYYTGFIKEKNYVQALDYMPGERRLHELSFRMADHALISLPKYGSTRAQRVENANDNAARMEFLFGLWQQALPLLCAQPHTRYLFTYGMKNVTGRPVRRDMRPCVFMPESPELCFLWTDQGEHYELEMRFKVGDELLIPNENNTAFFLNAKTEPMKFYLLGISSDYKVVQFFARHNFKLSVLKAHYKGAFEDYLRQLSAVYTVNTIHTNH